MGLKFNPTTGELDLTGPANGGTYPIVQDSANGKKYRIYTTNGVLTTAETTEALNGFTQAYYTINQESDTDWLYFAKALNGTPNATAQWRVWRESKLQLLVQRADGNDNYDNVGSGLAALTYS